ncbi:MAG: hypothetical protein FWF05_00595 [Oscillospiraceae bacterium]|nr:hypothetical protein [Oscillospiraceae bacterium]
MMYKTLAELSGDYYDSAAIQEELIMKNRAKLAAARRRGDKNEEVRLTRLIYVLYAQRRELLETAAKLKHYYRNSTYT